MNISRAVSAFPSLESLTIEHCSFQTDWRYDDFDAAHSHTLFRVLGGLKNLNKLEFDTDGKYYFTTPTTTASGPSRLLTLSALSKLETLLLRADILVYTTGDKKDPIHRAATIFPDSLRCLTLLVNERCEHELFVVSGLQQGSMTTRECRRLVKAFFQEAASALLIEHPHLEEVNLCYDMEDYRQHKVHLLAARSTAGGGAAD